MAGEDASGSPSDDSAIFRGGFKLSYCAEEIANMRHHALFRRFISALTRPGGLPRPFEVYAHDPLRYVGDMLGWLHQIDVPMDNPLHSSIITSDCNEGVRIDHREVGEEGIPAETFNTNFLPGQPHLFI
ncbi:hypothetical protein OPV22_016017 [Ensete ventricosum]|uniref:Conserved Oligomeric Golgi complex subunit 6 C-terminal domain-containing protein n=1 Tax=Ensete ventricosum TaxID=4639 RepID=A0AAV8QUV6_ENSVE|nr:hypothetical protein OPV22_016017 [Ensete ventricosum]